MQLYITYMISSACMASNIINFVLSSAQAQSTVFKAICKITEAVNSYSNQKYEA